MAFITTVSTERGSRWQTIMTTSVTASGNGSGSATAIAMAVVPTVATEVSARAGMRAGRMREAPPTNHTIAVPDPDPTTSLTGTAPPTNITASPTAVTT